MDAIRDIDSACATAFKRLGFKRRREGLFFYELPGEIAGMVGLNRKVHRKDGTVEINPVVGVTDVPLERRISELRGVRTTYLPATVSVHLGYLMPGDTFSPWLFARRVDIVDLANRLAEAIEQYGLPFMRRCATRNRLYELMAARAYVLADYVIYQLPVIALLTGRPDLARKHLLDALEDLSERRDPAAEDFRKYAARLTTELSDAPSG